MTGAALPSGDAVVVVRDLRKSYGETKAIDGIDFEVGRGEVFGLLGPNGAGKTTTVEILFGGTPFAPLWLCVTVLLGFLAVCFGISARFFRWQ